MKTIFCLILSCAWLGALGASMKIEEATVTLPYTELAALLSRVSEVERSLEAAPATAPVDVIVRSAQYRLDCVVLEAATLEASFAVTNLSDTWQSVLLVEASEAIRSVDPVATKLVQREGGLHLLLEPHAEVAVTLGLPLTGASHSRGGQVVAEFFAIGAVQSSLTVSHGSKPESVAVIGAVGGNAAKTEFSLSASGGRLVVKLYEDSALEPTRWRSEAQYLVRDAGGTMEVLCHLRLKATDGGRTSQATLRLPSEVNVSQVNGVGSVKQSVEMTVEGPVIHFNWGEDEAIAREIYVAYMVPLAVVDERVALPVLQVSNAVRADADYYLTDFDGLELSPMEGGWSDAGRPPEWIIQDAGGRELDHYAGLSGESLILSARLLPRLQTASATILLAEYTTEVVAEGGRLHQGSLTIEHGAQADYEFTLPESGKLLACTLDGSTTAPIVQEDGTLRLMLPRAGESKATTRVGYTFTTKGKKMNPVEGKLELALPQTPLFIHKLTWTVQLPREYQATALEGNVAIDAGGADGKPVRLSKQICDGERPVASLYYTRRDLQR